MTTYAQGIRSQLLSKTQSAFGTTATGNYNKTKYVSHSLDFKTSTVKSQTIRSDREIADFRHTTRSADGDVVVELAYSDFDDFIASAMFNTWGTDSITIGTAPQYMSLEDGQLDVSKYRLYKDMLVSKWAMKMAPGAIVQSTFSFVGTAMTASNSTGGGTAVAAGTNQPFDTLTGSIYDDAAESGSALGKITGVDFTLDNQAKATFVVGSRNAAQIEYGMGDVSGQLTMYMDATSTFLDRYTNETEFGLSFSLTDPAGHGLEFQMPRVKLGGNSAPVQNPQSRVITLPFQALKPTTGLITSALQVSRF